MNKYELAVVVSAKIEDDARAEVIEKVKDLITRVGGNVTDVDEWGKRRFAYEIQKMKEGFYYFIHFEAESTVPAFRLSSAAVQLARKRYFTIFLTECQMLMLIKALQHLIFLRPP